ncbi:hypothetical protein Sinac_5931 [Singulisphaera acidiphila DSM 18658]|uniref:Uncharacterized protein n=1 Tax=Singulisphaera acidiphila (strain ATCC BAA-1392 / DSM 18658 / VKM B-2454 / MOB10) TaxID=886293 RepID=L0DMJ2_SINAD|nr:hypothetical protein Sinac_5931 [Singulisphaera acidiphila DSM 18658]
MLPGIWRIDPVFRSEKHALCCSFQGGRPIPAGRTDFYQGRAAKPSLFDPNATAALNSD